LEKSGTSFYKKAAMLFFFFFFSFFFFMSSIRRSRSTLDTDPIKQRQSKRDEVSAMPSSIPMTHLYKKTIRKKLEHDLQKRGPMARVKQTKKVATVSALQPMRGLVVKETLSMVEAAQLMAARSSHCLLVMNQQEQLCGILTAKDIAYRGVATSR
jgi:CBS domain-containing protein